LAGNASWIVRGEAAKEGEEEEVEGMMAAAVVRGLMGNQAREDGAFFSRPLSLN